MDKEREEEIVRTFFVKRLQDRVIFELYSPQKRKDSIWRLCHDSEEKLNYKCMIEIPKPNSDYNEIVNLLKKYGAEKTCYCISINDDIDGKYLPISEAIENAVNFELASLISCIPNKLAYFQEEQVMDHLKGLFYIKNEYCCRFQYFKCLNQCNCCYMPDQLPTFASLSTHDNSERGLS